MTKRNRKKKQRSAKSSSSALTAAAESKAVYRPASVPEVKAQPAPESKADSNVEWLKKLPQPVLSMVFTYLPMLDHIALIRTCVACRVAGNKPSIWAVLDFSQLRFSGALARPFDDAVLSCAHLRPTRVVMVPRPGVGLPTHRSYPALKDMRTLTSLAIAVRPGHWDYLFPVLKGKPLQHLDIDLFPAQGGLQLAELPLTKLTLREAYRHYGDSTKECEQLATLKRLTRLQSLHVPWFNELILSAVESLPLTALSIGQSTHPRNALVSYDHAAALAKLSSLRTLAYHGNDVGCPLFRHMLQLLPLTSLEITGRQDLWPKLSIPTLERLVVSQGSYSHISDPRAMALLPRLHTLHLLQQLYPGDCKTLASCKSLTDLGVRASAALLAPDCALLEQHMPQLRRLSVTLFRTRADAPASELVVLRAPSLKLLLQGHRQVLDRNLKSAFS